MKKSLIPLFLLILSGVLVSIIPYSWMSTWSGLFFNAMHFPAFFALGYIISRTEIVNNIKGLILFFCLPALIELVQLLVGRSADIVDLIWGYVGLLSGMYLQSRFKWFLGVILGVYILWIGYIISEAMTPYIRLPLIADFESKSDFSFIRSIGEQPQSNVTIIPNADSNSHFLSLDKGTSKWSGLHITYDWHIDLTQYQGLKLKLRSRVPSLTVDIKFVDEKQKSIVSLKHNTDGWQTYSIPFKFSSKKLNWDDVISLSIYVETEKLIYPLEIDDITFY